jgi:hypothetical protein
MLCPAQMLGYLFAICSVLRGVVILSEVARAFAFPAVCAGAQTQSKDLSSMQHPAKSSIKTGSPSRRASRPRPPVIHNLALFHDSP